jgi:hypothetical protein|tara:strand:- start:3304 stop:3717 length:414 start_codon:yes stop_codon:yes gene_type:complete
MRQQLRYLGQLVPLIEAAAARMDDFLRFRLDRTINLRHRMITFCEVMHWHVQEQRFSGVLPAAPIGAVCPALPLRILMFPLFVKHAYNPPDEQICARRLECQYWQLLWGEVIFRARFSYGLSAKDNQTNSRPLSCED